MATGRTRTRCVLAAATLVAGAAVILVPRSVIAADKLAGEDHWAFKPAARPDVPTILPDDWARNPIDAFVLDRLHRAKLAPSPEADRRTLIRRVYFDLIGLPPTPEEIESFVADSNSDAYENLVDALLASPHYGERWARHWFDVVRFAESNGYETNIERRNAYPYRDWVIQSLNADKPYDQFVREQIAGDAFGADAGTGFLVGGTTDIVKSPDPVLTANQRADELHDMVSTTGSAFLGLTVGCARCHDHKFDPISQVEYYRMVATFAGVQHGERPLNTPEMRERAQRVASLTRGLAELDTQLWRFEPVAIVTHPETRPDAAPSSSTDNAQRPGLRITRNVDRFAPMRARFVRFTVHKTTDVEPCIDELEIYTTEPTPRNVALASLGAKATASGTYPNADIHKLEHLNDGRYGNEWSWISNEIGKGWVQIELPEAVEIDRVVWGRDRNLKFKDRLALRYDIEVAEQPGVWTKVAGESDRRAHSVDAAPDELYRVSADANAAVADELKTLLMQRRLLRDQLSKVGPGAAMAYFGTFQQPGPTFRMSRGDPTQPKEPVTPGSIAAVGSLVNLPADAPEQERRVRFAAWITDPSNPLTARVIVNRLWQYHFGQGLVTTPSDFGNMGATPSHPELLDWLANELVTNGWKLKPMHRLMVLSATYRQSSTARPDAMEKDAGTTLLWRYPPRRLEAEAIRDAILATSGKLDLTMGGPGFDVFKPDTNYVRVYEPKDQWGPPEWRRMVYSLKVRSQQDGTFGAFDCPDGAQITPKRATSITPLQALNLSNGSFVLQQSELFSERLKAEVGLEPAREANRAFLVAFGRVPTDVERDGAVRLINEHGLPAFCRALFNANEFVYVR